jgi:ribonuclease P protein component
MPNLGFILIESIMLSKAHRISKQSDFSEIYQSRKVVSNQYFRANFDFKAENGPLVAVVASKKVGKANVRNDIRRRVKAAFKNHGLFDVKPLRIVITCKPQLADLNKDQLQRSITALLNDIRVEEIV